MPPSTGGCVLILIHFSKKLLHLFCVHVCSWACACSCQHVHTCQVRLESQRTVCRRGLPSSTACGLGLSSGRRAWWLLPFPAAQSHHPLFNFFTTCFTILHMDEAHNRLFSLQPFLWLSCAGFLACLRLGIHAHFDPSVSLHNRPWCFDSGSVVLL